MLFGSLLGKSQAPAVFLGSPEAEAEATISSRMALVDAYEDYHGLVSSLSSEKFIVIGRKGSGKSAFAEYVYAQSLSEPLLSCEFIRKTDCDLERAVQLGRHAGVDIDAQSFFRWVIYTNILKMFVAHPAVVESKDFQLLKQFLEKNSGYIKINELELKELVGKHGFDVAVEYLRRFLTAKFSLQLETRSERAPYYKLLGHLEEVIVRLLKSDSTLLRENSFVLFFDDLDVGFDVNSESSVNSLVELLRACRYVNNDIFGKNAIHAKAVILLRDDIEAWLAGRFADTAKMFASYAARINWYQEEFSGIGRDENSLNLKKFIAKRIGIAFKRSMIECGPDPWRSLVIDAIQDKASFRYIVSQTLFRPRDLLLYFMPLQDGIFKYPLNLDDVRLLGDRYASELAKELKNELSSFYNQGEIETIFRALGQLSNGSHSYDQAVVVINESCVNLDAADLLDFLFERSLIGTVSDKEWYTFRCRQSVYSADVISINRAERIVVQNALRTYLRARRY
jgi:hypothetical protein